MGCKNICTRYKATKHRRSSYYAQGYKRCSMCDIFIEWDGTRCPCCDLVLRTVAHQKTKKVPTLSGKIFEGLLDTDS
jgi:hypothetical protein